jgi:hypothetical protein
LFNIYILHKLQYFRKPARIGSLFAPLSARPRTMTEEAEGFLAYRAVDCRSDHLDHRGHCRSESTEGAHFRERVFCSRLNTHPDHGEYSICGAVHRYRIPSCFSESGPRTGDCTGAAIIDEVLTTGVKSGYNFTYTPGAPDGAGISSTHNTLAPPVSVSVTGQRAFCSMQDGVIHYNDGGAACDSSVNGDPTLE